MLSLLSFVATATAFVAATVVMKVMAWLKYNSPMNPETVKQIKHHGGGAHKDDDGEEDRHNANTTKGNAMRLLIDTSNGRIYNP